MLGTGARAGGCGGRYRCRHAVAASLLAAAAGPAAAQVGGTPAGTPVTNVADLAFTIDAVARTARSNPDRLIVAERLDVALALAEAAPPSDAATPFVLVNAGNGEEAFALGATRGDGAAVALAEDVDGDGGYDPAVDRPVVGGRIGPLGPGRSLRLLALAARAGAPIRIEARAVTGSGTPGSVHPGAGDGGGDAVVGPTGAAATLLLDTGAPASAPAGGEPSLVKSQRVVAPDGSARAASGSTITYTLAATFAGPTAGATIEDPVPAGTRFVAGSLTLDGRPLSDGADADAGEVADGTVRVRLGDPAAGAAHTVTFTVTVS